MASKAWQIAANNFIPMGKKNIKAILSKLQNESLVDFTKAANFFFFYPQSQDIKYEWSNPRSEVFFEMLKEEVSSQFMNYFATIKKNYNE